MIWILLSLAILAAIYLLGGALCVGAVLSWSMFAPLHGCRRLTGKEFVLFCLAWPGIVVEGLWARRGKDSR